MISAEQLNRAQLAFPILQHADTQTINEFQQATVFTCIPANKVVFMEGDRASNLALVLTGTVRVYKTGRNGREITLYRFGSGDSCILSANAILTNQHFPANAIVEQAVEAVMIPESVFRNWVERFNLWWEFFFRLLSLRLTSVLALVDDLVFRRMDDRTASFLLAHSQVKNPINITHHEIAIELGSSREVVSRILEGFAAKGFINATRGLIEVLDYESLTQFSSV